MDAIIERLRGAARSHQMGTVIIESGLLAAAADEIERLRKVEAAAREYISQFGDDDGRKDDTDLRAALKL